MILYTGKISTDTVDYYWEGSFEMCGNIGKKPVEVKQEKDKSKKKKIKTKINDTTQHKKIKTINYKDENKVYKTKHKKRNKFHSDREINWWD